MKIGIVEDEAVWRDKIQTIIENYCRNKKISFQINSYGSGKEFMKNPDADLLFLDIELTEGEDGFGIAEQLMKSGSKLLCNGLKVVIGRAHSKEFKKEFFQWRMRFGS